MYLIINIAHIFIYNYLGFRYQSQTLLRNAVCLPQINKLSKNKLLIELNNKSYIITQTSKRKQDTIRIMLFNYFGIITC